MSKSETLKDGTTVVLRSPNEEDIEASVAFFRTLPEEDRTYLRVDVTQRDAIARRFRDLAQASVRRVIALAEDRIVADGALELHGTGWKEDVAELRLIVARPFQRKGLGLLMAREIYSLASAENVKELVAKFMRPQLGARRILRKLGFSEQVLMPDYVKDRTGRRQDLVIMRCDIDALWKEYEAMIAASDWQRAR